MGRHRRQRRRKIFTPLSTEFLEQNKFQPHYQKINREDQVQIYEALTANSDGDLTTSFLGLRTVRKDNRLLPRGWKKDGPEAEFTHPVGEAESDPDFTDGTGSDTLRYEIPLTIPETQAVKVTATLCYQSLPPYYLKERFQTDAQPASRNLRYFVNQMNLDKTPMKDWKLDLDSDVKELK